MSLSACYTRCGWRSVHSLEREVALLQTFADQAVIAIENARLFEALEERTVDLTQALEQQVALAEVLRIIASSPTHRDTVLETIAAAQRL